MKTGRDELEELAKLPRNHPRRQAWLKGVNDDFIALRANPELWAQELAERAEWDCTLLDGLEADPWEGDEPESDGKP